MFSPLDEDDVIPEFKDGKVAGAYVIYHPDSGDFYIGSSGNVYQRLHQHKSQLARGEHPHQGLQSLHEQDESFKIAIIPAQDKNAALDKEQHLLDKYRDNENLINVATDARHSFKGLTHTDEFKRWISERNTGTFVPEERKEKIRQAMLGREVSEETRAKLSAMKTGVSRPVHVQNLLHAANAAKSTQVEVDGVIYPSAAAAGRAFNVDTKTVHNRVASQTERFKGWSYANKKD